MSSPVDREIVDPEKAGRPTYDDKSYADIPPHSAGVQPSKELDDEPDEDIDALIDDLESKDNFDPVEEDVAVPGGARVIPEDQLQTDTRAGLSLTEVAARRKKYGPNQMKEEKENLVLKFLGFFVGPIQFVMQVSSRSLSCCFTAVTRRVVLIARC